MPMQYMDITNEEEWLEKKKNYVSSTEVSALFGENSYMSAFELYHIKRGNIDNARVDNDFMLFGRIVEEPICEMIRAKKPDWKIEEFNVFAYDDEDKIASSFDRKLTIGNKKYALEIKSISYGEYKEKFIEHDDDDIEASPMYEIQMQNELECLDESFIGCVMAVFILDTRTLKFIFRDRDPEMGAALRQAIKEFWEMKEAPEPDFSRDKSLIAKLCPACDPKKEIDATKIARVQELAAQYRLSKDLIKQEEAAADAAYAEILTLLGDAKKAWTNDYRITLSDIKENEGKLITQGMVGTRTGARAGYKRLTITETKKGK